MAEYCLDGNGVDQVVDIAPSDGRDLAAFPGGLGIALDGAFDFHERAIVRLVALEPFVRYGDEAVGLSRSLMLGALALVDCGAGVASSLAGSGERHAGPASQRHALLLAEQPVEVHPALAAAVADAQGEVGRWTAL
jgi:hypothetical protein